MMMLGVMMYVLTQLYLSLYPGIFGMTGVDADSDKGAMVTVNVMGNKIGKEQLSKLQEMMKAHPTLVSLCGIADEATEANLSGIEMDADDAVVLADELPAKGALASLDLSQNNIPAKEMGPVERLCQSKQIALRK